MSRAGCLRLTVQKMEDNDEAATLEAVFIAANVREVKTVEQLLMTEGIEYSVRPHAFRRHGLLSSGQFDGLLFEVLPGQAAYCRKLFIRQGLRHGVVPPEPE